MPPKKLAEYRRKRDFKKTKEPSGDKAVKSGQTLRYVIQKHAASHLHFDVRLELDGVMKSWAVPKGPSLDTKEKRLAMEVEDHPIAYNTFEGTIPAGEYGGGTVMLWDRGTYTWNRPGDTQKLMREGLAKGKLDFSFHGERLQGSFALVRIRKDKGGKQPWLMIKHTDEFVDKRPTTTDKDKSIASGRTMTQIAEGDSKVWHSNRTPAQNVKDQAESPQAKKLAAKNTAVNKSADIQASAAPGPASTTTFEAMKATLAAEPPVGSYWQFEPKYDGYRILSFVTGDRVSMLSRNGIEYAQDCPQIASSLQKMAKGRNVVLDGELVAMNGKEPGRFQELQARATNQKNLALVIFDLLLLDQDMWAPQPLSKRRTALAKFLKGTLPPGLVLGSVLKGTGKTLLAKARELGWEGLIAKDKRSAYAPGHRSKNWLKLKVEHEQEFVVGGFTEPQGSRSHLGALLVGYYDKGKLIYAGHVGGGFSGAKLAQFAKLMQPLEARDSPFTITPKANGTVHWVQPQIVVQVRFLQWTADGVLRQPILLGLREDKPASMVTREEPV